jgi:hypothetical protein
MREPATQYDRATGCDVLHLATPGIGAYLTDEVFLYRVVAWAGSDVVTLDLEDCYALDVVRVGAKALRERGLRTVTPE